MSTQDHRTADVARVIGHRGAAGHAPENTLAGLEAAKRLGCAWVEFDVMLTRDERPVLIHDEDLARTTNGTGQVAATPFAALKGLDAGSWFGEAFKGHPVPSLEEAVGALAHFDLGANVELKPAKGVEGRTGEVVATSLQMIWPDTLPAPVVSSFSETALAAFEETAPQYPRALLLWKIPSDWRRRAEALEVASLHCAHQHLDRPTADAMLAAGYALRVYTVNDRMVAKRLFSWGVESVFTDYPDRLTDL